MLSSVKKLVCYVVKCFLFIILKGEFQKKKFMFIAKNVGVLNMVDDDNNQGIVELIKESYQNAQKERYKKYGIYVFDRWIFTSAMLLIFGWLFFVAYSYNFELDYFECIGKPSVDVCDNPFYKPATWKNEPTLQVGEYGTKPGFLFDSVKILTVLILLLALTANHLIHNKPPTRIIK